MKCHSWVTVPVPHGTGLTEQTVRTTQKFYCHLAIQSERLLVDLYRVSDSLLAAIDQTEKLKDHLMLWNGQTSLITNDPHL